MRLPSPSMRKQFEGLLPEERIRKAVVDGSFAWFAPGSQVERVEPLNSRWFWQPVECPIELDGGTLEVASANAALCDYVASLKPDEVAKQLILPVFDGQEIDCNKIPNFDETSDSRSLIDSVRNGLSRWPDEATFVAIGDKRFTRFTPTTPPTGQAILLPEQPSGDGALFEVTWNEAHTGCCVKMGLDNLAMDVLRITDLLDVSNG